MVVERGVSIGLVVTVLATGGCASRGPDTVVEAAQPPAVSKPADPLPPPAAVVVEPTVAREIVVEPAPSRPVGRPPEVAKLKVYDSDEGEPNGVPGSGGGVAVAGPPPPPPPPASSKTIAGPRPFGPDLDRPRKISGPEPAYTAEARAEKVEGKILVQCVVTVQGLLEKCKILKSLPHLDAAVLTALAQQKWQPATEDGKPVAVLYTLVFRFVLKD